MPDRKSLIFTLWIASSLSLLASMLVAPIRTSGFVNISPRAESLLSHLTPPPGQPTIYVSAAIVTAAVPRVNAISSENEEQDRADATDEPRVSFLIPCSFRKITDRQPIAPRSILSLYPLRC